MASSEDVSRGSTFRRVAFAVGLSVYGLMAVRYIFAASIVERGQRWFLLWDDAMISMQYARNLADGAGFAWNVGAEPVQGFTNLGVTLVMAALHGLPVAPAAVSLLFQALNLGVLVALLVVSHRLARVLFPGVPAIADGAAVLLGLYGPMAIWGLQGADFAIQALIATTAILWVARAQTGGQPVPLSAFALLALGVVVRLDFGIIFATVWLWSVVHGNGGRREALTSGAIGAVTLAAILVFGFVVFGDPLPNTFYLKATGNPRISMWATGWQQLLSFYPGFKGTALLAFVGFAVWLLARDPQRLVQLVVALVLGQFGYYLWVGGDWVTLHTSRYLMVAMPFCILVLAAGSFEMLRRFGGALGGGAGRTAAYWGLLAFFAWSLNPVETLREWHFASRDPMYRSENAANLRMGLALCDATAEASRIGIFWAGLTPYVCPRDYLDVMGRTDATIAKREMLSFKGGPGHAKWDWDYVFRQAKPDFLTTFTPEMQRRSDFSALYCVAKLHGPKVVVPVRKTSLDRLLDADRDLCAVRDYARCRPCDL
jgi:hypothetical protein